MAKTNEPTANETRATPVDGVYSAADLASAARERFGVSPELVFAALSTAGLGGAALSEAGSIIANFIKREVK